MKEHRFTLIFDVSSAPGDADHHVEALGAGGCDDAIVGVGKTGRLALAFDREAETARSAVLSAMADVRKAIPEAVLTEATPDLVSVTEVAEIVGRSRQNIRKLILSCAAPAPAPAHQGNPSLWHLADLLVWLRNQRSYHVQDELIDLAQTNMQLNIAVSVRNADRSIRDDMKALLV